MSVNLATPINADLATRFMESLNSQAIDYCHWKSNLSLSQALAGEEDLDILVDRKALPNIIGLLTDLGFKAAVLKSGANVPGIFHYYGIDARTGGICHVHLFSRVLTGESFVKSHTLPFESMLLGNCDYIGPVRVASRSAELALFVLRTFIKYGSLLDLLRVAGDPEAIRMELRWLKEGGDVAEAVSLLEKYCPVIDKALFFKCIETLEAPTSIAQRMWVARTVRRRLRIYAKYTPLARLLAYAQLLSIKLRQRLTGNRKNKTLHAGGAIVAFVGADATGKSTLVSETGRWLGSVFAVRRVHVGKPPSSWATLPVNLLLPLMRRWLPHLRRNGVGDKDRAAAVPTLPKAGQGPRSLIYAVRAAALAWDRYRLLIKVRAWAANGDIVICDRYPTDIIEAMDSPRLRELPAKGGIKAALYNRLARFENALYRNMPPPDAVLRLRVSVETAKQRNRNRRDEVGMDDEDYLVARHREIRDWHKHGTKYIHDIDTEQTLEATILNVKKAVWESL